MLGNISMMVSIFFIKSSFKQRNEMWVIELFRANVAIEKELAKT